MIFIYNRDEIQVDVLDIEPKFTEEISKLNTLEFETYAKLEKGYRVVYKQDGKPYEFIIIDSDYVRNDDVLFTYFCQDSLTELNAFPILDKRPQGSYKQALTSAFENTRWQLVFSADFSEAYTQNNSFYHISVLEAFSKVAEDYNIEWHTEYTSSGSKITGRKLVISKLGTQSNSRLEFGKNIKQFSRKISSEPIFTALYGYGKGEETESGGYGRRISFADINGGLAYVTNEDARLKYGIGSTGSKEHLFGFFIDEEETDKTKLLESTKKELERVSQPQAEYTVEAVNLHIDCGIGDTVPVIDDELGFRGNTRIIKVVTQGDNKELTFGQVQKAFTDSFTKEIQKSAEATEIKITSIMETRLNQIAEVYFGEDGYNYDLKAGNEYNLPAGLYSFDAPIDENPTKVIYFGAGKLLIADSKATDGGWAWKTALDGQGIVGSSIVAHSITANQLAADVGQSLDLSSNVSITQTVKSETQSYIDANKDQLKGADGNTPYVEGGYWYINGTSTGIKAKGQDGVSGKNGVGIVSTTIVYAVNQSGTTYPTTGWSGTVPKTNPGDYIWTKTTWKYTDDTSEDAYSVGRIGVDGPNGEDGLPGAPGVGIKMTTITYTKSTSGTVIPPSTATWSPSPPAGNPGEFIWTKTVWTYTDNTTETGYSVGKIGNTGPQGPQGIQGANGKDGAPGKGIKETKYRYAKTSAPSPEPTESQWSTKKPDYLKGDYAWTQVIWEYTDGTVENSAPMMSYIAEDGVGISNTLVAYALSTTNVQPSDNLFSPEVPDSKPGDYVWTRVTLDYTDPSKTDTKFYTSARVGKDGKDGYTPIKGIDYVDGKDGLPGPAGTNSYTHIAYAKSADGSVGFSTTDSVNKTHIGIYVDSILADSEDYKKYKWTQIRGSDGKDGVAGKDGVGVKTTTITYGLSTSESTKPTSFTSEVPALKKGQYLWTKTVWSYSDNTTETGYSKTYIAKDGNNGTNGVAGKDGTGIKTTVIQYAQSSSGTVTPTSGWTTDIPSVAQGNYLWTKTTWNYTDNTSETGYSVARVGQDGARGIPGTPGTDGKTPYLHIAYATDTKGTNFSTTVSQNQTYIGTYTDFVKADSTDYSKYNWTKIKGEPGVPGIDGIDGKDGIQGPAGTNSYTHIAYANNATGTSGFSVSDSLNKTYIGIYVDSTKADSTDPSKYKWTLIKGQDGKNGTPGTPGADGRTPYFHVAYADDEKGTNFSVSDSIGRKYIGTYTDYIEADSTKYADYKWQLIKGADGTDGKDGATPVIQNGYWYINGVSTGIKAEGTDGTNGTDGADGATPYVGTNGNWWIDGIDTGVQADVGALRTEFESYRTQTDKYIADRVTKTEYSGLTTRVAQAEQKLTPTSITQTVESNTTTLATKADVQTTAENWTATFSEIGGRNLLPNSHIEKTESREYVMYANLTGIFDEHGPGEYTFSFDLKLGVAGDVSVYCKDRDNTNIKYIFPRKIFTATTKYQRYHMTVNVSLNSASATHTSLAFYGTYDTGRIPTVKNIKIEKGSVATDWTPAPEDIEAEMGALVKDIENVNSQISTADGNYTTLAQKVNGQVTKLTSISQTVDSQQSVIADLKGETGLMSLSNIRQSIDKHQSQLVSLEQGSMSMVEVDAKEVPIVPYYAGQLWAKGFYDFTQGYDVIKATDKVTLDEFANAGLFRAKNDRLNGSFEWNDWERVSADPRFQISDITQEIDKIVSTVYKDGLLTQINQQAGNVLMLASGDGKTSRLNLTRDGTFIDTALIQTAHIADLAVTDAKIGSLNASKIKTGTLDANIVNVINLNVSKLVGDTSTFVRSAWNAINSNLTVDGNQLVFSHTDGTKTVLDATGLYTDVAGAKYRHSYLTYANHYFKLNAPVTAPVWVTLPPIWKGRKFEVMVSIATTAGMNALGNESVLRNFSVGHVEDTRDYVNGRFQLYGICEYFNTSTKAKGTTWVDVRYFVQQIF